MPEIQESSVGVKIGTGIDRLIGFHGVTGSPQRKGAAQTALTDSTGGTAADAVLADGLTAVAPAALTATAPAAATVESDITTFSDPPTSGEMAVLVTFVNALKADNEDLRTKLAAAVVDLGVLRTPVVAAVADITTQNNNDAKVAVLLNEIRGVLVDKGLMKGAA
jgi:hypothetical protein